MGLNEAGNVEVKISFIASSDATNFAPFPFTADSLTVVGGKICMELPPARGTFFYRFRVESHPATSPRNARGNQPPRWQSACSSAFE